MQARHLLVALASLAYIVMSQWLMMRAPSSYWTALALVAPVLAGLGVWAWRARQRWVALCALAAIGGLLGRALDGGAANPERLYLAQHAVIHFGLAAWFGLSLRRGAMPLISRLATRVHRHMSPKVWHYTRQVTVAWTIYFVGMATLSLLLFHFAGFDAWAVFANVLTPAAVVLMFAGEYALRYRLHPDFERVGMLDAVRAYVHPNAPPAAPPRNADRTPE